MADKLTELEKKRIEKGIAATNAILADAYELALSLARIAPEISRAMLKLEDLYITLGDSEN